MSYYINYIGISHTGKIRKNNQDSIVCNNKHISESYTNGYQRKSGRVSNSGTSVFAVFDGMGGLSHGEIASSMAAKIIEDFKFGKQVVSCLSDYCTNANEEICNFSTQKNLGPIGTTAAILVFTKRGISLCNIGDSKIFRIENGVIEQISKDHTIKCAWGNQKLLTQNLGIPGEEMRIAPYLAEGTYQKGDIYLICSDGLTDMVSKKKIRDIVHDVSFEYLGETLLNEALDSGGRDNISIILCKVEKSKFFDF